MAGPIEKIMPSAAWAEARDYLTGRRRYSENLPRRREAILGHGRRLPVVVASDLWRRHNR